MLFCLKKKKLNRCPLQWEHRVLTTGPPGKPPMFSRFVSLGMIFAVGFW